MSNVKIVHLFHSPLWVNLSWRTSIFLDAPRFIDDSNPLIVNRLRQCNFAHQFEQPVANFILSIAEHIDNFICHVSKNIILAIHLGLRTPLPKFQFSGYAVPSPDVIQCLFRCVFLDRVLWAFGILPLPAEIIQRRHSDTQFHPEQVNYNFDFFLEGIQQAITSTKAVRNLHGSSFTFDNPANLMAFRASSHKLASNAHSFISKALYALVGTIYSLEKTSGKQFLDFLQKAKDTQGTSQHILAPIIDAMLATFETCRFRQLMPYYLLWIYSPIAIFCENFPGGGHKVSQTEFLEKTGIPVGRVPYKILAAERSIIKYFLNILTSSFSEVESPRVFNEVFSDLDPCTHFNQLMIDLDTTITSESSGDLIVDRVLFLSYVDGLQTYTFSHISTPQLFFSKSQGRKMSKPVKQIAEVTGEGSTNKKGKQKSESACDEQSVACISVPPLPPLPSAFSQPTQLESDPQLRSPSHWSSQDLPLPLPGGVNMLPPSLPSPPASRPPKSNGNPSPKVSKNTNESRTERKKVSWWLRQKALKKAKKAAKKPNHLKRKDKCKPDSTCESAGEPTIIIQRCFPRLPNTPEECITRLAQGPKREGNQTEVYQRSIPIWVPCVDPAGEQDPFGRVLFKREMIDVPFTNHTYPLRDLMRWLTLCGFDGDEPPQPVPFCQTISKTKFESLSVEQQRGLWRKGSIHIFDDRSDVPDNKDEPLTSFKVMKDLGVNMVENRTIYENQRAKSGTRHGSLYQFFTLSREDRIDCNVSDIPLPMARGYSQPGYLRNLSLNEELCGMYAPTDVPYESLQWCSFATPPARTDIRIDANRLHIWVNPQSGIKLWMIQEPSPEVEEVDTRDMDNDKRGKWHGVILRPGDVFIIPANTNCRVVTLVESVTMGGYFYSIDHLERIVLAGRRVHLWGDAATNNICTKFEGMIYRLGAFLEKVVQIPPEEAALIDDEEKGRLSIPAELESEVFARLISMLLYPQRFMPRSVDDEDDPPAELLELREMSRKLGCRFLRIRPNLAKQVCDLQSRKLRGE